MTETTDTLPGIKVDPTEGTVHHVLNMSGSSESVSELLTSHEDKNDVFTDLGLLHQNKRPRLTEPDNSTSTAEENSIQDKAEEVPNESNSTLKCFVERLTLIDLLPNSVEPNLPTDDLHTYVMERFKKKLNVQQIATTLTELDLRLPDDYGDKIAGDESLFEKILKQLLDKLGKVSDVKRLVLPTIIKRDGYLCSLLDKSLGPVFDGGMKFKVVKCVLSPEYAKKEVTALAEFIANKFQRFSCAIELEAKEFEPKKVKELESEFPIRIKKYDAPKQSTSRANQCRKSLMPKSKSAIKLIPIDLSQIRFTSDDDVLNPFPAQQVRFCDAYSYWNLETVSYTGKNTVIAIVDSGVNAANFEEGKFHNNLCYDLTGSTFTDKTGHGTLRATIAASSTEGVARDAKLIAVKVTDDEGNAAANTVALAMERLVLFHDKGNKIDVVSLSLGSNMFVPELCSQIMQLLHRGVIVVCAASNNGHQFRQSICFPANIGSVLCIGSHDFHGKASSFSPVGQQLDFLAPGENISQELKSGTSFAAPAVAGLICLILESIEACCKDSALTNRFHNTLMIKEILKEMSTNPGVHLDDRGYGALDPTRYFRNPTQTLEHVNNIMQS